MEKYSLPRGSLLSPSELHRNIIGTSSVLRKEDIATLSHLYYVFIAPQLHIPSFYSSHKSHVFCTFWLSTSLLVFVQKNPDTCTHRFFLLTLPRVCHIDRLRIQLIYDQEKTADNGR